MQTKMEFDERLDDFFRRNGCYDIPTDNKLRIRLLQNIAIINENDAIVLEQQYTSNKNNTDFNDNTREYISKIRNLDINTIIAKRYIRSVKSLIRYEKKENIKKKILSVFKKGK